MFTLPERMILADEEWLPVLQGKRVSSMFSQTVMGPAAMKQPPSFAMMGNPPGPPPKFCRHCGSPVKQGDKFCRQCGGKLQERL